MAGTRWNAAGTGALKATWLATRAAGLVSERVSGLAAARLWFTPWRVPLSEGTRAREAAWLEPVDPLRIPFDAGALAGFTAGDGPPVLLVHGWGERASAMGAFISPLVASGHRVVGIDLPGHGGSTGGQTDALKIAAALRATSDELGGLHAVVAHSMGAHATTLALSEGLEARAAVLLAPAVRLEHGLDLFGAMFQLPPKAIAGLRATIERRYGDDVWRDLAGDRLARTIECPVLIVRDSEDDQVDPDDAELLAHAWPGARLSTTTGLGHNKVVRDPDVVRTAVEFVSNATQAGDKVRTASG